MLQSNKRPRINPNLICSSDTKVNEVLMKRHAKTIAYSQECANILAPKRKARNKAIVEREREERRRLWYLTNTNSQRRYGNPQEKRPVQTVRVADINTEQKPKSIDEKWAELCELVRKSESKK